MNKPIRIQRKRVRGWKMPPNTVYVGRPTVFGNPFIVNPIAGITLDLAIEAYEGYLKMNPFMLERIKKELGGKNLACWCPLHKRCHVDVLLKLANE